MDFVDYIETAAGAIKQNECDNDIAAVEEVKSAVLNRINKDRSFCKRMIYFTLSQIERYFNSVSIHGIGADDVFQTVIEKVLTGQRKWNRTAFPDIEDYLRIAILSYVRNERKRVDCFSTIDLFDDDDDLVENYCKDYLRACVLQDLEKGFITEDFESLSQKLLLEFEDDEIAYFVLEEKLNGTDNNSEIAARLGIPVNDVINASRRIKYKYITKLKNKFC